MRQVDKAGANLDLNYGSLERLLQCGYAGAAPWLGVDRGAFVQQIADNAKGKYVLAQTWATDPTQGRYWHIYRGLITEH